MQNCSQHATQLVPDPRPLLAIQKTNNNNNNKDVYSLFTIVQYMYIIYLLYCSNVFLLFILVSNIC